MKYQLPQFIETETKIVGPLTLKQFIWVTAGGALSFLTFMTIGGILSFILCVPIIGLSLSFAFLKINEVPLLNYFAYFMSYTLNPKKYIYTKEPEDLFQTNLNKK
jgi:hypothetical protein